MEDNILFDLARSIAVILFSFIGYPSIFIYAVNAILDAQIQFNLFNVIVMGILFFLGGGLFRFTMYAIGYNREEEQ